MSGDEGYKEKSLSREAAVGRCATLPVKRRVKAINNMSRVTGAFYKDCVCTALDETRAILQKIKSRHNEAEP